jgi:hypothetical protein
MRRAAEAIARCPTITADSFADTEFTSVDQPYLDLDDDIWAAFQDDVGQSHGEQEDECLPKEGI